MVEQAVTAVIASNPQAEAVAGNSGVIFTATDRKIIEERGGEINRERTFLEVLQERPTAPKVENEETNIKPEIDLKKLQNMAKHHRKMLKHATLYNPQEHVEITGELPDTFEESREPDLTAELPNQGEIRIIEEKETETEQEKKREPKKEQDPAPPPDNAADSNAAIKSYDKMVNEQKKLTGLGHRIKVLHLTRLLTNKKEDFEKISNQLKTETIGSIKRSDARSFMGAKLDQLTIGTLKYKLNFLRSMQSMQFDKERAESLKWIEKALAKISKPS